MEIHCGRCTFSRLFLGVVAVVHTVPPLASSNDGLIQDEVAAYAYFGKETPHGVPQAVSRYSNLTMEQFEELALSGRPFVIEDGGKDQPFVGWSCDRFRKEYPNSVLKVEYVRHVNAIRPISEEWESELHKIPKADPGGPQYAPWYWGVKGAHEPEEAATIYAKGKNPLPQVQSTMRLPPWMRQNQDNQQEVLGSPEFWFSMPQAGATMHMDAHCESTYAIQLSGTRKWRLGWVPPIPDGKIYKDGTYADGKVYGKQYSPPLEAVVSEGQAFFMPSAYLHETTNVGDDCAVSLTFQFRDPIPARYFRQSLRHLRRTQDFRECFQLMSQVASLSDKGASKRGGPSLGSVDKNGDGKFSRDEATTRVLRAAHAFHDTDQDGEVSEKELQNGWAAWTAANNEAKAKGLKKELPKSFAYLAHTTRDSEL